MKQHSLHTVLDGMRRAAIRRDGAGLSDGELFEAYLAERDRDFLEALIHRHGPMVFGVCQRLLRNPHDAEDAFQATFLVLVRRAEAVWPRDQVGHWLYGVAYRTALEARRRAARRQVRERPLEDFAAPTVEEENKEWHDIKPLLDREVNGLPAKYRSVVVLCDLEGQTRKEAARHLGLPEGTVSGRLTTARRLLAKRLTRQGVTVSASMLATLFVEATASAEMPATLISTTLENAASISAAAPILALADAAMRASVLATWKTPLLILLCVIGLGVIGWGALNGANRRIESTTQEQPLPKVELSPAAATDRDRLQGTWVVVAGELDGVPNPQEMLRDLRLVFDGNRVMYWTHKGAMPASVRLDPTKNPKEIDMEFVEGNTLRGIYQFDGQRLKFCWTKLGVRPKSFDTMAGDILTFLFVYKKQR